VQCSVVADKHTTKNMTDKEILNTAYTQTMLELRINKIQQILFWYDNVPSDEEIVNYIMEWRELRRQLKELGISNSPPVH
jgi:hypothetical protein